jgi:hypothetical protein
MPQYNRGVLQMRDSMKILRGFLLVVAALFLSVPALRGQSPKALVPIVYGTAACLEAFPVPKAVF